jgi:hypothetical protein
LAILFNRAARYLRINPIAVNRGTADNPENSKVGIAAILKRAHGDWVGLYEQVFETDQTSTNSDDTRSYRVLGPSPELMSFNPSAYTAVWSATGSPLFGELSCNDMWFREDGVPGYVASVHGGNNQNPTQRSRQIGFYQSSDLTGAPGTWSLIGSWPSIAIGASNATDGLVVAGGFVARDSNGKLYRDSNGDIYVFYRGQRVSGALAQTHLAKGPNFGALVKQGVIIAATNGTITETGVVPGSILRDASGRFHMWVSIIGVPGGVAYFYTDATDLTGWTEGNGGVRVVAASGAVGSYRKVHVGDNCFTVRDGDAVYMITACGNQQDYAGGLELDGKMLAVSAWPEPTPRKLAKFYHGGGARAVTNVTSNMAAGGALPYADFILAFRVRKYSLEGRPAAKIFTQRASTGGSPENKRCFLGYNTSGRLEFYWATPTNVAGGGALTLTGPVLDDTPSRWREGAIVRRGSTWEMWLRDAFAPSFTLALSTTTSDPGTDSTAANVGVGNWLSATGEADEPLDGSLSDLVLVSGVAPAGADGTNKAIADMLSDLRRPYAGGTLRLNYPVVGTDSGDVVQVEGWLGDDGPRVAKSPLPRRAAHGLWTG